MLKLIKFCNYLCFVTLSFSFSDLIYFPSSLISSFSGLLFCILAVDMFYTFTYVLLFIGGVDNEKMLVVKYCKYQIVKLPS